MNMLFRLELGLVILLLTVEHTTNQKGALLSKQRSRIPLLERRDGILPDDPKL